jgi:membrane protease subunit HflC
MTKNKLIISVVVVVLLLIASTGSLYVVNEKEQVVITQFGRPEGNAVVTPGIQFKVPFIQKGWRS